MKYAVNTNWDLFQYVPTNTYYLRNDDTWLKPSDVKGAWAPAGTLPDSFKKLPAEDNWKDVLANLPGKPLAASAVPKIFVSFLPAELILLTGEPIYAPGRRHEPAVGQQHRERRLPVRQDRARLLPRHRPVVLGARLHRTVDVCHALAAGGLQEDSARARPVARAGIRPGHGCGR